MSSSLSANQQGVQSSAQEASAEHRFGEGIQMPFVERNVTTMSEIDASKRSDSESRTRRSSKRSPKRGLRVGAILAIALAAGLAAWVVLGNRGDDEAAAPSERSIAAVSRNGLETLAGALGTPIYWAGPRPNVTYEVTQTPSARVFVRYLPAGAAVETSEPYLFVATFPVANAFPVTGAEARKPGSVTIPIGNGGVAFYSRARPTNVYIAFPGTNQQIQVFDPDAANAHRLVEDGAIGPVLPSSGAPSTASTTVDAASLAELKGLSGRLGQPVYWVGARSGGTYELTETPGGRVFIRYLPKGVKVGSSTPSLFVATFPFEDAFAATERAAQVAGAVRIPVGGGAVAFYSQSSPSNVYLAFPGSDYQIEVFDPNPRRAHALVRSGKVQPISS